MMSLDRASQEILDSLEPDNVECYTVAFGNAFTGIRCEGIFESIDEAAEYAARTTQNYDEWNIVTIWKGQ
jgi:hypothetical protein